MAWKKAWLSTTMRDHKDWIKEVRATKMGGHLEMHLSGRTYTVEFLDGLEPTHYVIDRERSFDERHGRVDDAEFSQIVAALKMAVHDCFAANVHAYTPSAAVFEIQFAPGHAPFGNGRRVFIEGRLADLMREHIGKANVTFEYPVRVDGAAPQWVKMEAATITGLDPVA
ncbi:MAG TPA: hypothetical protein VMA98_00985 [Candidatus Acidoferrales bacterium]|nr:hypothetical protein [Candidatus Acidoferrales bacterium]